MEKNYWGYRIDTSNRSYFSDEIKEGRLRQGWGYEESQNLRNPVVDESAKRNLPIFEKVKEGDILLVPRIESWDEVAIVRETKDFNAEDAYYFKIDRESGMDDYGHVFPVELLCCFSRNNDNVDRDIRTTLKCKSRFWNINWCGEAIEKIISTPESELRNSSTFDERFRKTVEKSFDEDAFSKAIYEKLNSNTQASEWEYVLCEGFRKLLPNNYDIQTTSNKSEKKHGSDIIIRIPGILNNTYVIAIQVKDYTQTVDEGVIDQICKADDYFAKEEGATLVDKYLFIIRAKEETNSALLQKAKEKNVKVLFDKDVKKLLSKMARAYLGEESLE